MNRCKDCKYFKDDCGFANVDKQLHLDGNFAACVQFQKSSKIRDGLSCGNNFFEEGDLG